MSSVGRWLTHRLCVYQVCLERCGDNIANDLAELKAHAENLTAVSFEAYDLGSDGSLVNNHFTSSVSLCVCVCVWSSIGAKQPEL